MKTIVLNPATMDGDPTEGIRRDLVQAVNSEPGSRESLEEAHGQVWNTEELNAEFEVLSFLAPYIMATRKSTGKQTSLMFQHTPRFYFGATPS